MSILWVWKLQHNLRTKKSCLFPPQTTNPKVGSISVVFLLSPLLQTFLLEQKWGHILPLRHTAVTFSPSILQGLSNPMIFSSGNYSDCLGSLSLQKKPNNKKKSKRNQKQIQRAVPTVSRINQPWANSILNSFF